MNEQKKRQGCYRSLAASKTPSNPAVQSHNAVSKTGVSPSKFPEPFMARASAAWHMARANRAKSIPELEYYVGEWIIRHALAMREVRGSWPECAWAAAMSAATASGLHPRWKRAPFERACKRAADIAMGGGVE